MERHDFDPIAMIAGVVFTGLGLVFLAGRFDALGGFHWLWPGLLVVLGLATLLGTLGRGRSTAPSTSSGAASTRPAAAYHEPPPLELPELDLTDTSGRFELPGEEQAHAATEAEAKTEAEKAEAEAEAEPQKLKRDGETEA